MKVFVVFAAVVAAASANPQYLLNNHGLLHHGHAITYSAAPVVSHHAVVAPLATKTQYHAQDELGQASYGYAHPGQAHAAVRDAAGNVRGSYAYVNPEGKEVRVEYVADGAGFRVASNALPVAPVAPAVPAIQPLAAVQETPEVAQARAAHAVAHAEALARSGRKKRGLVTSAVLPTTALGYGYSSVINHPVSTLAYNTVHTPVVSSYAAPALTYNYNTPLVSTYNTPVVSAYSAPVVSAYTAPAVREATLTKVVNTPGHAVSYRVD